MRVQTTNARVLCLLAALLALPATPRAADVVSGGDCAAALRAYDAGAPIDRDARAALGYCLVVAERFEQALAQVPDAVDAASARVRGMALYHLGRHDEASAALAAGGAALDSDAEVRFYRGMLAWHAGSWRRAARELDRARRIDPAQVEPAASYHAALAWRELGDTERAREALQRVSDDWAGTAWAQRARRQLDGAPSRPRTPRSWAWIEIGGEGDDNVVLRGTDVPLPLEISQERDQRATWRVHAGRYLLQRDPWSAGAALSYSGWMHDELDEFDVHFPSATFWLDRELGTSWAARVQYDTGFAWVDDDSFLAAHDLRGAVFHGGGAGRSELFARAYVRDYRFPIADVPVTPTDEAALRDRDGKGAELGAEHALPLPFAGGVLKLRYAHERFDSEGREYSFEGNGGLAELRADLPLELRALLSARYQHRAYRHPSSFAARDRDRSEDDVRWAIELERPLPADLKLIGRFSYRRNRSNVQVFDFRRHVTGIYVRWDWSDPR